MPRAWDRAAGSEDLESLEGSLDESDLHAVAGEVAVTKRRLGEFEMGVRVLDEARHVGRQCRAGVGAAVPLGRGVGVEPGAGVGPGVGVGVGDGAGAPLSSAASSRRSASPRVSAQTTWRGDATTMRVNSGNADPVDCR
jgi:hypothetical protein